MEVDSDTPRAQLKRSCFRSCDKDGDGFLNKAEMKSFAQYVGFDGTPAEWEEEFKKLCTELSLDISRGVPEAMVLQMMDDETKSGCYCTNSELREILDLGSDMHVNEASSAAGSDAPAPAEEGPEESPEEHTVFFTGANIDTDQATLQKVFETAGTVKEINLFRWANGSSRGMGCVKYATAAEAQCAISTMHRKVVDGRELVVAVDYSQSCKDEKGGKGEQSGKVGSGGKGQLGKVRFAPQKIENDNSCDYGKVRFAPQNSDGGNSWDYRKVRFAPQKSDGGDSWDYGHEWDEYEYNYSSTYSGSDSYDDRDSYSGHSGGHTGGGDGRTVFFGGVPYDTTGAYLLNRFRTVGRVQAFWLFTLPTGQSRGMGLVQYQTAHEARVALETLSNCRIGTRQLRVAMDEVGALSDIQVGGSGRSTESAHSWGGCADSYAKEEQYVDKSGIAEPPQSELAAYTWASYGKGGRASRFSPYGPSNSTLPTSTRTLRMDPRRSVFFANVPYQFNEEGIAQVFEEIGRVRSCVLFRTAGNLSRGMGVVEYMTAASAARAFIHLHGYRVAGRRLVIDEYENYE